MGCPEVAFGQAFGWRPPIFCPQGNSHWSLARLRLALPAFARVYDQRPIRINTFGVGANHAFSLWYTVRTLKPLHIIESGVWCGQTTWLLRQAAGPEAHIYSLDPLVGVEHRAMAYRDDWTGRAHYFLAKDFIDFADMDWDRFIPPQERSRTLVVLDDHKSSVERLRVMQRHGFMHLFYEDNFNYNYGFGDTYSFNLLCSALPAGARNVSYRSNVGDPGVAISLEEHQQHLDYLRSHVDVYYEFQPILDECGPGFRPTLLPNVTHLRRLGLPAPDEDSCNYCHCHPAYVRLKSV